MKTEFMKIYESLSALNESTVHSADDFSNINFKHLNAGTTTYDISIDNSNKKTSGTFPGPQALVEILKFINTLTQEEKDNLGLGWWGDANTPGDCCGDTIVFVVAPSEAEEFNGGRYGSNLSEVDHYIKEALGIDLDTFNILMEPNVEKLRVERKASKANKVGIWDIYLEPSKKGTGTSAELNTNGKGDGTVFETEEEALEAAGVLLNELDDEGELGDEGNDPDDYYVEAFSVDIKDVDEDTLNTL